MTRRISTIQKAAAISDESLLGMLVGFPFGVREDEGLPVTKSLHHLAVGKSNR
jgi:hypothetical protein